MDNIHNEFVLDLWNTKDELIRIVEGQLKNMFLFETSIAPYIDEALKRAGYCFSKINSTYYHSKKEKSHVLFSPYQSGQYAQFLYYLSHIAYKCGNIELAEKVYYLNKSLNSVEWFYEVNLPNVFYADHPIGCVLGRAKYGDFFMASQGCTVGNNHDVYPILGDNVVMHPYSMVIGNSHIGNFVEISAYAFIRDEDIPDCCIVFGMSPNLSVVEKSREEMMKRVSIFIR